MSARAENWLEVCTQCVRYLFFAVSREEMLEFDNRHLTVGLVFTWLVGMGRYWDNERAELLQMLGVGSVVYVFVLSGFLWVLIALLKPEDWDYTSVLTLVTLTSPPGLIYAIPVEMFYSVEIAATINAWFLAVVAAWRVALLVFFIRRYARLPWAGTVVASLFPLTIIVVALAALNLQHVAFNIMSGIGEVEKSVHDTSYGVIVMLSMLSMFAFIPLAIWYGIYAVLRGIGEKPAEQFDPESEGDEGTSEAETNGTSESAAE